mgnify:CR=1 FL=1
MNTSTTSGKNNVKIALFFKNSRVVNVDASKPELGNPGFGGRQFMNLNIAYHIASLTDTNIKPTLYCEEQGELPQNIHTVVCGDLFQSMTHAKKNNIDIFILDASLNYKVMDKLINYAETLDLNIIIRLGLIPSSEILKLMSRSNSVKGVVCVEQFVFELIRDHPVFEKATVLTNGVPVQAYGQPFNIDQRKKNVIYLGSLVPQKGFDKLARVWKKIVTRVPDAQLLVCGLGTLYGADNKLGEWGVASENYESKSIRPYLSDTNGRLMKSVRFLGNLGHEKNTYLKEALVGVANPTGLTETFCISAVEIQAAGTAVIAGAKDGLFDTVDDGKTGILVKNQNELSENIIYLLENAELAVDMGRAGYIYTNDKYDLSKIAGAWHVFINNLLASGSIIKPTQKKYTGNYALKFVSLNSKMKKILGSPFWWPSYMDFTSKVRMPVAVAINKLKKKIKSY